MSRTNPSEAIERLAMTLNFPRREPLSINELSEKTGLSWATTQKYVQLLETLGRIAPKVSVDEEGVTPLELGANIYDIQDQKDIRLVIYLFAHAKIEGSPTASLDIEDHSDVLDQYKPVIDELEQIGWIERTEDTIQLTPEGVSIAGPAYSRIKNQTLETSTNTRTTQSTSKASSLTNSGILIEDSGRVMEDIKSKTKSEHKTDWGGDHSEDDFRKTDGLVA